MDLIADAFQWAFGWLFDLLGWIISCVVSFLPDSPFQAINNSAVAQYIGYANWFLPVSQIIAELELWLSAVIIFYAYRSILAWIKAIG